MWMSNKYMATGSTALLLQGTSREVQSRWTAVLGGGALTPSVCAATSCGFLSGYEIFKVDEKIMLTLDRMHGATKLYIAVNLSTQMGFDDVTEKEFSLYGTYVWTGGRQNLGRCLKKGLIRG